MKVTTFTKVLFASMLAAALAVTASAGFTKKNTYNGNFSDVKNDAWYAKEVASAYELGFVEGVSDKEFSPNTTVTVAQGITMASRVHAEYNGKTITGSGENWYDVYVKYAKDNGIITENQFDSYTRELKRSEMAELFYDAMPDGYYKAINNVKYIPDVPIGAMYWDKLITLYNAGIVMGSDGYGSFNPDSSIVRSECAAIINRVAIPENRKQGELEDILTRDAYVLAFNKGMAGEREVGIASGWVLDNRGGAARTGNSGYGSVADISTEYATAYIREFNYVPNGRLVVELNVKSVVNGGFVEFRDIDEKSTYMIKIVDGKWSLLNKDGSYKAFAAPEADTFFRIVIDLDKNTSTTYINNVNYGDGALLSDNILSMRAGVDEKGTGSFTISQMDIPANYAVYEDFDMFGIEEVYGWTASEGTKVSNGELYVNNSKVTKKFDAVKGIVTLQTYFISRDGKDLSIDLDGLVKLEAKSKKLTVSGKELYNLTQNMWYRLKVEADINTGKANIWLNGRVVGVVDLAKKAPATSLTFETTGNAAFDNIFVYETLVHADYVAAPEAKASLDDYIVAMNVCSLWRNGVTNSWACISPYDDHSPLIGYFDEGIPETADWEIKQMVDHGIDVQAFCWYGSTGSGPMKYPSHSAQLHEGYMYAKYSDYMKYCLIWEASSTGFGSGQFRNYIVPYWFENYFLDDRYLKIDNKIVLSIYNAQSLATTKYFGSNSGAKTELEYLENKAKEYGFDGVIFLANGTPSQQFYEMGFDGTHAYSWGEDGRKLSENKSRISSAASSKNVYGVPTVSVGFDSIPWHNVRYGLISVEDYNKALEWLTTEQMPNNKVTPDWAEKLIWLSTWNEYGEGTFITPSGFDSEGRGFGYGYLDALRKYTTNLSNDHTDLIPTPKQQSRICHLYPQYARLLRREGWYKYEMGINSKKNVPENKLYVNDVDILENSSDDFYLPPVEKDGKVYFPFNPSTAVNYILNCHYNWRKNAGTFEIMANGHTLMFEVGSDMYVKDGKTEKLGYTVTTLDGVPYFDYVKLAKDLGLKVEEKDGNVYVYSNNYESAFKAIAERKTGWWDFDGYDAEGWESTQFDISVADGAMKMVTNTSSNDPTSRFNANSFPKDFYAQKYTDLEIKVRFKYNSSVSAITFYFLTEKGGSFNEAESVKFQMAETDTNGEWRTFTKKLDEIEAWRNAERITAIRLDPFNATGEMEFDYIHFIEDPDFVYVAPEKKEFAIVNGDAEGDEMAFHSSNTKISIIEEPGNKKNHVYYVQSSAGACYAYMRHPAEFEMGATYRIEYDIKLVGNNVNDENAKTSSFCANIRYPDKTASGAVEHIIRQGQGTAVSPNLTIGNDWVHYVGTHTVTNVDAESGHEFTIYVNPNNGIGFHYYVDNIVVKKLSDVEKAKSDPASVFDWETAEGPLYTFDDGKHPFSFSALEGNVEDGVLVMKSTTSNDVQAQLNNLKLDADKAVAVAIRYKAKTEVDFEKTSFDIFFDTKAEPGLTADKVGNTQFSKYIDEGNGWYTVIVNMAINPKWTGTITTLRLDPANSHGTYYFDKVQIFEVSEK